MMSEGKGSKQSMGGVARAQKLSRLERSDIAKVAAEARWENEAKNPCPKATHGSPDRPLTIGGANIPCYVLEDGKRVITQGGMLTALELSPGTATKGGGDRISNFLSSRSLNEFVPNSLRDMIMAPTKFKAGGSIAYGYEATILADICDVVLEARKNSKKFNYQLNRIADQCEILVRAFARVGIIALVDEATGFQELRDKNALQEILKKYISKELLKWVNTFPIDFYKEMFRLHGWAWNSGKMPGVVGKYTNDLVYERLAPGVLDELRKKNPVTETGRRKYRHHQYLTRDLGHPSLTRHLYELLGMMRASKDWDQFYILADRTFPRINTTRSLPI